MKKASVLILAVALWAIPSLAPTDDAPKAENVATPASGPVTYVQGRYKVTINRLYELGIDAESEWWSTDRRHYCVVHRTQRQVQVLLDGEPGELYDSIEIRGPRSDDAFSTRKPGEPEVPIEARSKPFSPDGKHMAYVGTRGGRDMVVLDGKEGKDYEDVTADRLCLSPNSKHLAYVAMDQGKSFVVLDGKEGSAFHSILKDTLQFSRDGEHLAYMARMGDSMMVVIDGKPGPAHPLVSAGSLRWTADAAHVGYVVQRGLGSSSEGAPDGDIAVVDGREYPTHGTVSSFDLSPDGLRHAVIIHKGGEQVLLLDGVEVSRGGFMGKPLYSLDGKHLAFVSERRDGFVVVLDGKDQKQHSRIVPGTLAFSPDGARLAYTAIDGGRYAVVVDGVEGARYDKIELDYSLFTLDGRHIVYRAVRAGQTMMVFDGRESEGYDKIYELAYSPDGGRAACLAQRAGQTYAVIDGVTDPQSHGAQLPIVFSPNGKRVAFAAKTSPPESSEVGKCMVIDGKRGKPYFDNRANNDNLYRTGNIAFSPDSRLVAYVIGGQNVLVVGSDEIPLKISELGSRLLFIGPSLIYFTAKTFEPTGPVSGLKYRVTVEVEVLPE